MAIQNLTGRNVRANGTHLNSGLGTMADFNLVTAVENKELSHNCRFGVDNRTATTNDLLSNPIQNAYFTQNSGAVITNAVSYSNSWGAAHSQFIAPYDCSLKSVNGYVRSLDRLKCPEVSLVLSVWMKETNSGTTSTPVNLIFRQTFVFAASSDDYVLPIDGTTYADLGTTDITSKKAIIVSVRRSGDEGEPCGQFQGSFNMVFKSNNSQTTSDDFKLNTISVGNNRYDNTVSNPNKFNLPK
tara:strand:+ start:12106 stop:12831 length:726 start_codon:yes stop_codon:yes gene_type:complete